MQFQKDIINKQKVSIGIGGRKRVSVIK